jgi:hypothetical protein
MAMRGSVRTVEAVNLSSIRSGRPAFAAVFAFVVGPLAAVGVPGPAVAVASAVPPIVAPGPVDGYVVADQSAAAHYTVGNARTSTNGVVEVERASPGVYQVRFAGMGVLGGVAHARPYGAGNTAICTVAGWAATGGKQGGGDELVHVRCFDDAGAAGDSQFVASFTNQTGAPGTLAYVFADRVSPPFSAPYVPRTAYDSTATPIQVQRNISVGQYLLWIGSVGAHWPTDHYDGVYQITAVGTNPVRCEVWDENEENHPVFIGCVDADGDPVDSRFTLTYAHSASILGTPGSPAGNAVYFHDPTVPSTPWWLVGSWSTAGTPVLTRLDPGRYQVDIPALGLAGGYANAGAHSGGRFPRFRSDKYCHVASWSSDQVVVECFDSATDTPADSDFTLMATD